MAAIDAASTLRQITTMASPFSQRQFTPKLPNVEEAKTDPDERLRLGAADRRTIQTELFSNVDVGEKDQR